MREALQLLRPRDVFPFAVNTGRAKDIDHPVPYRPPDDGGGDWIAREADRRPEGSSQAAWGFGGSSV